MTIEVNNPPTPTATTPSEPSEFVYLTKRIRIPKANIYAVKRPAILDGRGAMIETNRGITTVCETYEEVMRRVYGEGDSAANAAKANTATASRGGENETR